VNDLAPLDADAVARRLSVADAADALEAALAPWRSRSADS